MPAISQVTGDPTILSFRKCRLEVMRRGLAASMLCMSRSYKKLTRALGLCLQLGWWDGKFSFTEDPSLVTGDEQGNWQRQR